VPDGLSWAFIRVEISIYKTVRIQVFKGESKVTVISVLLMRVLLGRPWKRKHIIIWKFDHVNRSNDLEAQVRILKKAENVCHRSHSIEKKNKKSKYKLMFIPLGGRPEERFLNTSVRQGGSDCSLVHDQINYITKKADNITSEKEQISLSTELKDLVLENSTQMNTEDIIKTSEIIDKLIEFNEKNDSGTNETKKLSEEVRANILKTIDNFHESTPSQELARDGVAHSLRSSAEKLVSKLSKDAANSEREFSIYLKERTMGVVVEKKTGNSSSTSFLVTGNKKNYSETSLADHAKADKPILFSVKVTGSKDISQITAILYNSSKFYPDEKNVQDLTTALADQFTDQTKSDTEVRKVVSVVTAIDFGEKAKAVEVEGDDSVEMKFRVDDRYPGCTTKWLRDRGTNAHFTKWTLRLGSPAQSRDASRKWNCKAKS
jgi:hypothetical protein